MASNIYSMNFNKQKRGSVSVGRQKPQKIDQQSLQLPIMHQLNFPIVQLRKQQNISAQHSMRQRYHKLILANPLFEEQAEKNVRDEFDNFRTQQTEEASDVGILSKYFPDRQHQKRATERNDQRTNGNTKQLSQSVQVRDAIHELRRIDWSPQATLNDDISQDYHPQEPRSKTLHSVNSIKKLRYVASPLTEENEIQENSILPKENLVIFNKRQQQTWMKETKRFPDEIQVPQKNKTEHMQKYKQPSLRQPPLRKFKAMVLLIRAVIRLSKKQRGNKKQDLLKYQKILQLREQHQEYINQFQVAYIKKQHRKFTEAISKKIITFIKERQYINECEQIWQEEGNLEKDMRRTRFCVLTTLLMQNLEFLTRKDNLPLLIQHQLNTCLFKSKSRQISLFVANRGLLFSKRITKLTQEQKILVASEYFLFEILTSNLLEIFNDIKASSITHKNCTLYYCVSIINLLQTFFTKYHKKLTQLKYTNITPIQKKLNLSNDSLTGEMQISLTIETQTEQDDSKIIFGNFKKNQIEIILKERKKWGENMFKLFSQTIFNLQLQIQI